MSRAPVLLIDCAGVVAEEPAGGGGVVVAVSARLSSSDFGPALEQFLGSSAGLSAATITRLTTQWQGERTASDEADILLHKRRSRGPDGRDDVTNAPLTPVVLRHQADILLHKG